MGGVALRRVVLLLPILFGVSVLTFLAMHLMPGDLAVLLIGQDGAQDPVALANIRKAYGLDQPLIVQYLVWLGKVVRGDFGVSLRLHVPVLDEIVRRLPLTLEIAALAIIFGLLVGGGVGILAATRGRAWGVFGRVFTLGGVAVPSFVLATILLLVGSRYIPFIPTLEYASLRENPGRHFLSLIYPVIALGSGLAAVIAENMRASMEEVLSAEYVRVGRAKGLRERVVLLRHVLPNALIPIVTITGLQATSLIGGTIIIESIFALPGLGRLALSAVSWRDYPLMQGIVLVVATLVVLCNLAADLAYAWFDPRIRLG